MAKSREELEKEYAEATTELGHYQHKQQRLENRIRYYTEGERKKRNHRLITRGGAVESIVPEVRGMNERAFFSYGAGLFPAGSCRPGGPRRRPAGGRIIGTVPLPCHPGQAERGPVCCGLRRLSRRGETV